MSIVFNRCSLNVSYPHTFAMSDPIFDLLLGTDFTISGDGSMPPLISVELGRVGHILIAVGALKREDCAEDELRGIDWWGDILRTQKMYGRADYATLIKQTKHDKTLISQLLQDYRQVQAEGDNVLYYYVG